LLAVNPHLQSVVAAKLQDQWSPQQISGWLRTEHSDEGTMQVSHETIYKSLFIQARGVLKRELMAHLRSRRIMRRGKTSTAKGQPRGQIIDAVSIHPRPVELAAQPGNLRRLICRGCHSRCRRLRRGLP
jgi:IS30 family transposase